MTRSCSSSDMNAAFMQYRAALAGQGAVGTRQAGLAGREVAAVPGCHLRQRSSLATLTARTRCSSPAQGRVSELSGGVADGLVEDRQAEREFVLGGRQWRGDPENAAHAGQLHDVDVQA